MKKDIESARNELLNAFPGSFINQRDEFIAHQRANEYIILRDCETPEDIKAKVLEWFSRPACKTAPYSQEWRNRKFHAFMREGVNNFLYTDFSVADMEVIYQYLGNRVNHDLTMQFIAHGMDIEWLREERIA